MDFASKAVQYVSQIPFGMVTSYSLIASKAGSPRGARMVGTILRRLPEDTELPWHRVISKSGRVSIVNATIPAHFQAALLQKEGIEVIEEKGQFWIKDRKYFWED